jgi:predicted nucleic acid-binding protein
MSVVSNTGPLIALAKIDQLGLLERLFGQVPIPPTLNPFHLKSKLLPLI